MNVMKLPIVLGLIVALLSMAAYAHDTFRTNREQDKIDGQVINRLIRIEQKIDRVLGE